MALPIWMEKAVSRMSEDERDELSLMLVAIEVEGEV